MPRSTVGTGGSPAVGFLFVSGISTGGSRAATASARVIVSSIPAVALGPVSPVGSVGSVGPVGPVGSLCSIGPAIVLITTRRLIARWSIFITVLLSFTATLTSAGPLRTTVPLLFRFILEPRDFQIYSMVSTKKSYLGGSKREGQG